MAKDKVITKNDPEKYEVAAELIIDALKENGYLEDKKGKIKMTKKFIETDPEEIGKMEI